MKKGIIFISCKEKILIFFGSPHDRGTTGQMLKILINNLNSVYDIFVVNAFKILAKPCCDCAFCKENGKCQYQDLDEVYANLEKASKIIVVTPVYNCSFPAPLKAIFDRFQVYFNFKNRKIHNQKKVFLLFSFGGRADSKIIESLLTQCEYVFKSINAKISDFSLIDRTDENKITTDILKKCSKNVIEKLLE